VAEDLPSCRSKTMIWWRSARILTSCLGRSPEAGVVTRTRSSHPDRPFGAAQPTIIPQRAGLRESCHSTLISDGSRSVICRSLRARSTSPQSAEGPASGAICRSWCPVGPDRAPPCRAGRRLAGPAWVAAGEGPRRGYPPLRSPWHLPLARRLSCVFAESSAALCTHCYPGSSKSRKKAQVSTN